MSDSDERPNPQETTTVRATKRLFDESVERLDSATLSRLNRQRHKALAELHAGRAVRWQLWLPAAGTAAALAAALLLWQAQGVGPARLDAATDLDLLMDGESLEMLEDLEFYAWLEREEAASATGDHVG